MAQKFSRLKQNFYGRRHIGSCPGLDHRKQPPLVLYRRREAYIRSHLVIAPHTYVGKATATRDKLVANLFVAKIEFQSTAGIEPIVGPCLGTLSLSSNPATQQITVARISASIPIIGVKKSVTKISSGWYVGVYPFNAEVQFRNAWHMRKEKTAANCGSVHIGDGRELVVGKCIPVKSQPIAKSRQSIRPVQT